MSFTFVTDYRCLREGSEPGRVGPSRAERASFLLRSPLFAHSVHFAACHVVVDGAELVGGVELAAGG